jgi:hypothetical protein
MKEGHEVNLVENGLKPVKVSKEDLDIPFLPMTQFNSIFAMITREMRCSLRVRAAAFLKIAMKTPTFPKPEGINCWRHHENMEMTKDKNKHLFRDAKQLKNSVLVNFSFPGLYSEGNNQVLNFQRLLR